MALPGYEDTFKRMWMSGCSQEDIHKATGVPKGSVHQRAMVMGLPRRSKALPNRSRVVFGLPRLDVSSGEAFVRQPDPTPAEIEERCAAVRATWTPEVEEQRRVYKSSRAPEAAYYRFNHRLYQYSACAGIDG